MCGAALACSPPAGMFSVRFEWVVPEPEPDTFRVLSEVRAPDGDVTTAAPVVYRPGTRITFPEVRYGDGLIVELRFVGVDDDDATPVYFGRSSPFDLAPGADVEVPVEIQLSYSPRIAPDGVEVVGLTNGVTSNAALVLRVRAQGAEHIHVAQDFTFSQGEQRYDASQTQEGDLDDAGYGTYVLEYDLDATLSRCNPELGGDAADCQGLRTVFVQATHAELRSAIRDVALTLDSVGPRVVLASIRHQRDPTSPIIAPDAATLGTEIFGRSPSTNASAWTPRRAWSRPTTPARSPSSPSRSTAATSCSTRRSIRRPTPTAAMRHESKSSTSPATGAEARPSTPPSCGWTPPRRSCPSISNA